MSWGEIIVGGLKCLGLAYGVYTNGTAASEAREAAKKEQDPVRKKELEKEAANRIAAAFAFGFGAVVTGGQTYLTVKDAQLQTTLTNAASAKSGNEALASIEKTKTDLTKQTNQAIPKINPGAPVTKLGTDLVSSAVHYSNAAQAASKVYESTSAQIQTNTALGTRSEDALVVINQFIASLNLKKA